jgi:hypothetical protein
LPQTAALAATPVAEISGAAANDDGAAFHAGGMGALHHGGFNAVNASFLKREKVSHVVNTARVRPGLVLDSFCVICV